MNFSLTALYQEKLNANLLMKFFFQMGYYYAYNKCNLIHTIL